jgi:hypothetical protein
MNLKRLRNIRAGMPIHAASNASLVAHGLHHRPTPGPLSPPEWLELAGVEWPLPKRHHPVDPMANCASQKDAVIAMIGRQIRRPRSLIVQVKYGTFVWIDRYIRGLIQSER